MQHTNNTLSIKLANTEELTSRMSSIMDVEQGITSELISELEWNQQAYVVEGSKVELIETN